MSNSVKLTHNFPIFSVNSAEFVMLLCEIFKERSGNDRSWSGSVVIELLLILNSVKFGIEKNSCGTSGSLLKSRETSFMREVCGAIVCRK